jgi:hypothetical protein
MLYQSMLIQCSLLRKKHFLQRGCKGGSLQPRPDACCVPCPAEAMNESQQKTSQLWRHMGMSRTKELAGAVRACKTD